MAGPAGNFSPEVSWATDTFEGVAYRKCTVRMNINNAQHMDALAAAHMHATTQQLLGNAAAGRGLWRSEQQTKSK